MTAFVAPRADAQSACSANGDPRSVVKACTQIIGSSADATSRGTALVYRAYALIQLRDYDGALSDTRLLRALSPNGTASYELAGTAYFLKNDWQQSFEAIDEAIRRGSRSKSLHEVRGRALYELKRYENAIEDFDAALQADPAQNDIYGYRAMAYSKLHRYDKALPDINYAIWAQPQKPIWYLVRTEVLWNKGDLAGARRDIDKALELDPNNMMARVMQGTLKLLTQGKNK
jgi:tetratricopeptide (TPR) repeat protein